MPNIKGLIFDLDNTLFRCGPRYRDFYKVTAAMAASRMGVPGSVTSIVEALDSADIQDNEDVARFAASHGLPEKSLVETFNSVAGEIFPTLSADPSYAELLPDLSRLLAAVPLPMAVVTRGPRSWAEPVIRHIGADIAVPPAMIFPAGDRGLDDPRTPEGFRLRRV